jgi:tRNA A37 threonylcarbamoyladenosine biosynthesis protein TsaE
LIQEYEYIVIERPKFKEKLWLKNYVDINIKKISDKKRTIEIGKATKDSKVSKASKLKKPQGLKASK